MFQMLHGMGQWYHDFMANADPRIADSVLSVEPVTVLSIVALYVVLVTFGPKWMEQQKPMQFKSLLVAYNFVMVFLSAFVFMDIFLQVIIGRFSVFCQTIDYSDSYIARGGLRVAWCFFMLKVIELLDTIFFVLRKKNSQITFLHVYHHATMVIVTWLGMMFVPGGNAFVHPLINSLVHVVMYTYYGMAAIGPHMQRYLWWKRYLTMFQLTQFVVMISHSLINYCTECNFSKIFSIMVICYTMSIMLLFINFYYRAYVKKDIKQHYHKNGNAANSTKLAKLGKTFVNVGKLASGNHYINGIKPVVDKKMD